MLSSQAGWLLLPALCGWLGDRMQFRWDCKVLSSSSQAILVLPVSSAMCFFCPGLKNCCPSCCRLLPSSLPPQLAFLGFSSQAAVQGLGPIECLQKHLADPGHNNSERGGPNPVACFCSFRFFLLAPPNSGLACPAALR